MEPVTFRPVLNTEQAQALALWYAVFRETPGFFERYYTDADPGYREGDTLGAWSGGRLVSAVHLCRRPAVWEGEPLLCGAIANVATLPEFRRQGLSRRLLETAISKMEREGFHFSLLGTGVPGHYAALGWEQTHAPRVTIRLKPDGPVTEADWRPLDIPSDLAPLYAAQPRPLQFVRPAAYFANWVGWAWKRSPKSVCALPGRGYIILGLPEGRDAAVSLIEWRAVDSATERALLQSAASEALRQGHTHLSVPALPQHLSEDDLQTLGDITLDHEEGTMTRNVALLDDQYWRLVQEYNRGAAAWWSGDGF